MTTLHLAGVDDADRLLPLVAACHEEAQIDRTDLDRAEAVAPLLAGSPHGAVYLIGPARSPIGYVILGFGWSLEFRGLHADLRDMWIRPGVRGRGIGSEVLTDLPKALSGAGLRAMHLDVGRDDRRLQDFFRRQLFETRPETVTMTRRF